MSYHCDPIVTTVPNLDSDSLVHYMKIPEIVDQDVLAEQMDNRSLVNDLEQRKMVVIDIRREAGIDNTNVCLRDLGIKLYRMNPVGFEDLGSSSPKTANTLESLYSDNKTNHLFKPISASSHVDRTNVDGIINHLKAHNYFRK